MANAPENALRPTRRNFWRRFAAVGGACSVMSAALLRDSAAAADTCRLPCRPTEPPAGSSGAAGAACTPGCGGRSIGPPRRLSPSHRCCDPPPRSLRFAAGRSSGFRSIPRHAPVSRRACGHVRFLALTAVLVAINRDSLHCRPRRRSPYQWRLSRHHWLHEIKCAVNCSSPTSIAVSSAADAKRRSTGHSAFNCSRRSQPSLRHRLSHAITKRWRTSRRRGVADVIPAISSEVKRATKPSTLPSLPKINRTSVAVIGAAKHQLTVDPRPTPASL